MTYTKVREPKCCKVSKMKSCPNAPISANCAKGVMMDGWTNECDSIQKSECPSLVGWITGIQGRGKTESTTARRVQERLIQNIICWSVTLYGEKISSCVELVAPSRARLIIRYPIPIKLAYGAASPVVPPEAFFMVSFPKPTKMVTPTVTINTMRYLCGANLRR